MLASPPNSPNAAGKVGEYRRPIDRPLTAAPKKIQQVFKIWWRFWPFCVTIEWGDRTEGTCATGLADCMVWLRLIRMRDPVTSVVAFRHRVAERGATAVWRP